MDLHGQAFLAPDFNLTSTPSQPTHHLLSGSFRSLSLFLLAFSPLNRTLSHIQTVPAFGPHQYLATNSRKDRIYTTSWALPPTLSSWAVERSGYDHDNDLAHTNLNPWKVHHINSVPITATSSYITLPPPYTHLYSAGGPTGEVHLVDQTTGGFSDKIQQLLFVPEDELEKADKTRVALRYGSHAVEISPFGHTFIPVLGSNSIETYTLSTNPHTLKYVSSTPSPRPHDGPRHLVVSPDGKTLYTVTEHTNYLDVYKIDPTSGSLTHIQSRSLLPPNVRFAPSSSSNTQTHNPLFRGDTLRLSPPTSAFPSPRFIFATTRGAKPDIRGWVSIFRLGEDGELVGSDREPGNVGKDGDWDEQDVERWETPTSGGKANAIDLLAKSRSSLSPDSQPSNENGEGVWILLTDDDESVEPGLRETRGDVDVDGGPGVRVLEWDGWGTGGIRIVAEWPTASGMDEVGNEGGERMRGGSHAIWLD